MTGLLSSMRLKQRSMSECSEDNDGPSSGGVGAKPIAMRRLPAAVMEDMGSSPHSCSAPDQNNFLYDIDGKFAYSHYEKRPELYDIDGKHRYKFFSHLKRLNSSPSPSSSPSPTPLQTQFDFSGGQFRARASSAASAASKPTSPLAGAATATENVLYDIDGKFKYHAYDPNQHQFKK